MAASSKNTTSSNAQPAGKIPTANPKTATATSCPHNTRSKDRQVSKECEQTPPPIQSETREGANGAKRGKGAGGRVSKRARRSGKRAEEETVPVLKEEEVPVQKEEEIGVGETARGLTSEDVSRLVAAAVQRALQEKREKTAQSMPPPSR